MRGTGTSMFGCGCYISTSMFDLRAILEARPCATHVYDPRVQEALEKLAEAIRAVQEEENDAG